MLLTVLIVSGTILGATTIAGLLMLYQIRQSTNAALSLQALFAADSGLECQLYKSFVDPDKDCSSEQIMSEESLSSFIVKGNTSTSISSVGCAGALSAEALSDFCPRPITRAFQLDFQ